MAACMAACSQVRLQARRPVCARCAQVLACSPVAVTAVQACHAGMPCSAGWACVSWRCQPRRRRQPEVRTQLKGQTPSSRRLCALVVGCILSFFCFAWSRACAAMAQCACWCVAVCFWAAHAQTCKCVLRAACHFMRGGAWWQAQSPRTCCQAVAACVAAARHTLLGRACLRCARCPVPRLRCRHSAVQPASLLVCHVTPCIPPLSPPPVCQALLWHRCTSGFGLH
jgi:hypothetical protein